MPSSSEYNDTESEGKEYESGDEGVTETRAIHQTTTVAAVPSVANSDVEETESESSGEEFDDSDSDSGCDAIRAGKSTTGKPALLSRLLDWSALG